MRKIAIAIWILVSLLLGGCGSSSSPADIAKDFYTLVAEGKVNDAFALVDEDAQKFAQQLGGGANVLSQRTQSMKKKGGLKAIKVVKEEVTGDTAEVELELEFGNGEKSTRKDKFIKKDGEWRMTLSK